MKSRYLVDGALSLCFCIMAVQGILEAETFSLNFSAQVLSGGGKGFVGEVVANGVPLLRLRSPSAEKVNAQASRIAALLQQALRAGLTAEKVSVGKVKGGFVVKLAGQPLVMVDQATARANSSLPQKLAEMWANRLRHVLNTPFLMLPVEQAAVPLNEEVLIPVAGSAKGELTAEVQPEGIVAVSADGSAVRLLGVQIGDGVLTVSRGGHTLKIPCLVRKRAARLRASPVALVSGIDIPRSFLMAAAQNALLVQIEREPGTSLSFDWLPSQSDGAPPRLPDGLTAKVFAAGTDYLPFEDKVEVKISVERLALQQPEQLVISNAPETVDTYRVLQQGYLPANGSLRLLYHHKSALSTPAYLVLELFNISSSDARVLVRFGIAGPSPDEIYTGYAATVAFLRNWMNQAAFTVLIPPRSLYRLMVQPFAPGGVVSGIYELQLLDKAEVGYELLVTPEASSRLFALPSYLSTLPQPYEEGLFASPHKFSEHTHRIGEHWVFVSIGRFGISHALGEARLPGNYGVLYHIRMNIENPLNVEAPAELVFTPNAGVARGVFIINGELLDVPLLRAEDEFVLKKVKIAPQGKMRFEVYTMPCAGSNYPVTLIARS